MRPSRRGWATALVGAWLVALGLLLQRPVLLVGGGLVGAWLVAAAVGFVRHFDRTLEDLAVEHDTERERVATDRPLTVRLRATLDRPATLALALVSRPPPAARTGGAGHVSLDLGDDRGEARYVASWPHAGVSTFDRPALTATDPAGLFRETAAVGPAPRVTVEPRQPGPVHVGIGGERVAGAYGRHRSGRTGAGIEPSEVREYVPGDTAEHIDWKATARLARPHVREFEVETDRRTVLVVDHRADSGVGPDGETALDYLRTVALAYVETASATDDPLGCVTVGDEGLTGRWEPEVDRRQYRDIHRHLAGLTPTTRETDRARPGPRSPADARRVAAALETRDTPFARTLQPYFDRADAYVHRFAGDPLVEAVRLVAERRRDPTWLVLFTTDADPSSLRQAVGVGHRGAGRTWCYLAPTGLFEPGALGDLEAAYANYVAFEELRRDLVRPPTVEAYEVAPGDRIGAVLAAGRGRRRRGIARGGG